MVFENGLEGSAKELYDKLYTKKFDAASLRKELEDGKYDAEAVNAAAIDYVDDCCLQLQELVWAGTVVSPGKTFPGLESSHVKEALELLLDFGLDPNRIYQEKNAEGCVTDEYNIMDQLYLIDNGYEGADSLHLLLSHGGDPNLMVDGRYLLSDPYYDLWFDTSNRDMLDDSIYYAKIHYCMVLIGFGARTWKKENVLVPVDGFDLSELREHRNYYVGAIRSDKSDLGMELCFFDRRNNWEVARY